MCKFLSSEKILVDLATEERGSRPRQVTSQPAAPGSHTPSAAAPTRVGGQEAPVDVSTVAQVGVVSLLQAGAASLKLRCAQKVDVGGRQKGMPDQRPTARDKEGTLGVDTFPPVWRR